MNQKSKVGVGQRPRDSRRSGKPCVTCGLETNMGVYRNTPALARERWDGKQYLRYCGPECEKSFFEAGRGL